MFDSKIMGVIDELEKKYGRRLTLDELMTQNLVRGVSYCEFK